MKSKKLESCQYLRCLCVIAVFMSHIPYINFTDGQFGVSLFMIMSGFFIMRSSENENTHIFFKKLIKLIPLYWILTLILFIVASIKPNLLNFTNPTLLNLIRSLLFIPYFVPGAGHKPIINVGWYLNVEIFFSFIFSISNKLNNKYRGIISGGVILFLFMYGLILKPKDNIFSVYSSFYMLYYVIGMVIYYFFNKYLLEKQLKINNIISNIFIIILFLFGMLKFKYNILWLIFTSLFFLFIVLCKPVIFRKFFINVGNNSYSFYLIHYFVIAIFDRLVFNLKNLNIVSILLTIVCFFITYYISIIVTKVFKIVEIKLMKFDEEVII